MVMPLAAAAAESTSTERPPSNSEIVAKIREEGMKNSQVMETLSYLSDVIGPRLTGSPNLKHANEWTKQKLSGWGLTNAHLEAWGPFGRGWSLKSFAAEVIEPQTIPLIGQPNAWSPGFDKPLVADVVWFNVSGSNDLASYEGKLKDKIVLSGALRDVKPHFDAQAVRLNETNLLRLANAGNSSAMFGNVTPAFGQGQGGFRQRFGGGTNEDGAPRRGGGSGEGSTNSTRERLAGVVDRGGGPRRPVFSPRNLAFLAKEGAALVVTPSSQGDAGTFFVAQASVPGPEGRGAFSATNTVRAWSTNAPAIPPQITLAAEDYNRMVRMIQQGEKLKMMVDLKVQFHDDDVMAYNTVAEIPGTDLADQIVMLGGHMDSWHSGTGATDNGAGVAATMEAVRIIKALNLKPRRTIRIALWSGEEQGLYGSKAYVSRHFGYYTNVAPIELTALKTPKEEGDEPRPARRSSSSSESTRKLMREHEYEKLAAYFNLDNGGGRIRGIYMEGNEAVRPIFRRWLEPFRDLDAETLTLASTGGTDHMSFQAIGLPGFQFIQDPMDYRTLTHHSNEDVVDRIQPEDMKQAATIIAAFVYNAAMLDEKLPRKPLEENKEVVRP
jgi:carboxypeptidase Q